MFSLGWTQFLPFIVTVVVIVFTNLLYGIFTGLAIGFAVVLIKNYQNSIFQAEVQALIQPIFQIELIRN